MDVEVTEETPAVDDAPEVVDTSTTVVVPPSPDAGSDALVAIAATVGAHEERLNTLETRLSEVALTASTAEIVAEGASDMAVDAAIQAEEAAIEAETPEPEVQDEPPTKTHWASRSWSEWRSGKGGK